MKDENVQFLQLVCIFTELVPKILLDVLTHHIKLSKAFQKVFGEKPWDSECRKYREWLATMMESSRVQDFSCAAVWKKPALEWDVINLSAALSAVMEPSDVPCNGIDVNQWCGKKTNKPMDYFEVDVTAMKRTDWQSREGFSINVTGASTSEVVECIVTEAPSETSEVMSHHSLSPTSFHHVCSVLRCNPLLQSLSLGVAQFSTEDARVLCEAALSLKKLDLRVVNSGTHEAVARIFDLQLEELVLSFYGDKLVGDITVLTEKVSHCHLKRLELYGGYVVGARNILPILSGAKHNFSITDLDVEDWSTSEVTSAVATCGRAMRQLRKLTIRGINPLPLLRALGDRDCPLEHVTVKLPPWRRFSEEEWAQLEEAASCAQVMKVEVKVYDFVKADGKGCTVLAAGLVRNKVLKEAEFTGVPKYVEENVREILQANAELTVVVTG